MYLKNIMYTYVCISSATFISTLWLAIFHLQILIFLPFGSQLQVGIGRQAPPHQQAAVPLALGRIFPLSLGTMFQAINFQVSYAFFFEKWIFVLRESGHVGLKWLKCLKHQKRPYISICWLPFPPSPPGSFSNGEALGAWFSPSNKMLRSENQLWTNLGMEESISPRFSNSCFQVGKIKSIN